MNQTVWSFGLEALTLAQTVLLARKHWLGWVIASAGNVAWMTYGIMSGQWGFFAAGFVYGPIEAYGLIRWYRQRGRPS